MYNNSEEDIRAILTKYKKIAVVGLSDKPYRASYGVSQYMMKNGYTIIPVNPNCSSIFGLTCYTCLDKIPGEAQVVNIFRRSDKVMPIVEEAIKIKAKAIWMQLGVIDEEAARLAIDAGIKVVMDLCIKIEHARLL